MQYLEMFKVDSDSNKVRLTPAGRAQIERRERERYEREAEMAELDNLGYELRRAGVGRPTGTRTPATPALLGEGGRGIRREVGREAGTQSDMPDRMLTPPVGIPNKMPETERRAGAERLHPTSIRAGAGKYGFSMRDIKDLVERDADIGIEPSENPFVMSLWSHVAKENDKHKNCPGCSVIGNLAPRRGLARKIKYMSLNPSIYGNKYDVLGSS